MKFLALILFSSTLAAASPQSYIKKMTPFVTEGHQWHMEEAVRSSFEAAKALGITSPSQTDLFISTYLSQLMQESSMDPSVKSFDGSAGIAQTLVEDNPQWGRFWLSRKVVLEPFDESVRTQVFYGASALYVKLRHSKGDLWGAVRRYNGAGKAAELYVRRVMKIRAVIFKRPYTPGEKIIRHRPRRRGVK